MTLALGLDIGTTGVKALLIDDKAHLVDQVTVPHDLHSRYPAWAEEDPADWWNGVCAAARELISRAPGGAGAIAAVGVSGMVPAIVFLDADDRPLRPSIQQNDGRAHEEVESLRDRLDQDEVLRRTGSRTTTQHVGPRVRWIQRHEPEIWTRTRRLMGSYDYVRLLLTGEHHVEQNWAIESGLWDVDSSEWVVEYLAASGIARDQLPPVGAPHMVAGRVTAAAAAVTGLREGTPVAIGSADHVASALAGLVTSPGDLLIKFGGAGDILYCADRPSTDPRLFLDAHDVPGMWLPNGCMAASGSLVKWLLTEIFGVSADGPALAGLDREAEALQPGSGGVVCLPYFLGEKTPLFDPLARGVFAGLTLSHGRPHLFRAVLEAVIFGFQHHIDVLQEGGHEIARVFATNGGVRSGLWRGIAADVLGRDVVSFVGHPGSVLGAAFVAAMSIGMCDAWEQIAMYVPDQYVNRPDSERHAQYREVYGVYRRLYPEMRAELERLATIGGQQHE